MANEIIPFGKYRGQEIEQIKQRDPAYVQWLTQQAWFKEKFSPVYQVVVNNFLPPSEETPEHNALQVQFLEFDFRVAFLMAADFNHESGRPLKEQYFTLADRYFKVPRDNGRKYRKYHQRSENHQTAIRNLWEMWRKRYRQPKVFIKVSAPEFECISDIKFNTYKVLYFDDDSRWQSLSVRNDFEIFVEIKPSMGDDYPAVLRQIKRQQQNEGNSCDACWFLLIDRFSSQTVTIEQIRKVFELDNITIVMMDDVREAIILRRQRLQTQNP